MATYTTVIELDRTYRDRDTQFEGVATAIAFYRHQCERVQLRAIVSNVPADHWFDAPQLDLMPEKAVGFTNGHDLSLEKESA